MTNSIEIVDDPDEAEMADAVVCRRLTSPLLLPDNLIDICSKCGEAVQHRPHVPKRPPRICDQCILPLLEEKSAKGELHSMITPHTAREVAEYLEKKKRH